MQYKVKEYYGHALPKNKHFSEKTVLIPKKETLRPEIVSFCCGACHRSTSWQVYG